jgi:hypothetical protein
LEERKETPRICANCKYWRPHVVYEYIGFCDKLGKLTFDDDTCPYFEPLGVKDDEFYWCSTCKTRITGEEAREYLRKGHRIHRGAYVEPDIREELYSVF